MTEALQDARFLAWLLQTVENYNAESLAEMYQEWREDPDRIVSPMGDDKPKLSIEEQVDDAFRHVCMNVACKLESLLAETRKRGLGDAEVKAVLQDSESNFLDGRYSAWRTGAGTLFLQNDYGACHTVASVNELFAELNTAEPWKLAGITTGQDLKGRGHKSA